MELIRLNQYLDYRPFGLLKTKETMLSTMVTLSSIFQLLLQHTLLKFLKLIFTSYSEDKSLLRFLIILKLTIQKLYQTLFQIFFRLESYLKLCKTFFVKEFQLEI